MKKITVKSVEFDYQVCYDTSEYGDSEWTEFYRGTVTRERKKWLLFGERVKVEEPVIQFIAPFNIEDPAFTREEMKRMLEKVFDRTYGQEARRKEILEGAII